MNYDTGEILEAYNYEHGDYRSIDGTEDWVHVVSLDSGGGYDWSTLHAFYSPSARRYFWDGDTGCSCNSWGEGLHSAGDFQNGDKDALKRALRGFADDYSYDITPGELVDALGDLTKFKENQ